MTNSIDIDGFGFGANDEFRFIRLTDDPNQGVNSGPSVGADIDSVGAITSSTVSAVTATGTGILVDDNASPTILNNVIANTAIAIDIVNSVVNNTTIIGSTLFHNNATPTDLSGPNVGADALFQTAADPLFVDTTAFYPAAGSLAIDSSLNTLQDRPTMIQAKTPLGIPPSPIVAPQFDVHGQLRVDDPDEDPLGGGAQVFKDRGAVDRADEDGPFATLLDPLDNDVDGNDLDVTDTVVHLVGRQLPEMRVQLSDGPGTPLPFEGVGIDSSTISSLTVTVSRDHELLQVGRDYRFGYNETNDTLLITPLSEIWAPGHVYTITLNNRDRFMIAAPSGAEVADGDPVHGH